jgi:hypothetical protein
MDERELIKATMERVLSGTAIQSGGAFTVVSIAHEAGVPRNALTQCHTDPKKQFDERVEQLGGPSELEKQLRLKTEKLQRTITRKNAELKQLREDVPSLVRTLNQLTLENHQLRDAPAGTSERVVPLHERAKKASVSPPGALRSGPIRR